MQLKVALECKLTQRDAEEFTIGESVKNEIILQKKLNTKIITYIYSIRINLKSIFYLPMTLSMAKAFDLAPLLDAWQTYVPASDDIASSKYS